MRTGSTPVPRARGYAYVMLLMVVAVLGVVAAGATAAGSTAARRGAEVELLAIGAEFRRAILSYAGAPLGGVVTGTVRGPRTLDELLNDPRFPGTRRHLRQIYADPLTGKREWGLLLDESGFIVGIYSLADGQPIKQSGWEPEWVGFEGATSYRQWVFGAPRRLKP